MFLIQCCFHGFQVRSPRYIWQYTKMFKLRISHFYFIRKRIRTESSICGIYFGISVFVFVWGTQDNAIHQHKPEQHQFLQIFLSSSKVFYQYYLCYILPEMFNIWQLLVGEITYAVLCLLCLFNFNFHSLIPEKLLSAFSKKVQDCRHCASL